MDYEEAGRPRSWAPEVIADSGGRWSRNRLRFATKAEAEANVSNLAARWTRVTDTRVVETDDPINSAWVAGRGLVLVEGK
jgi:hypothetical protein